MKKIIAFILLISFGFSGCVIGPKTRMVSYTLRPVGRISENDAFVGAAADIKFLPGSPMPGDEVTVKPDESLPPLPNNLSGLFEWVKSEEIKDWMTWENGLLVLAVVAIWYAYDQQDEKQDGNQEFVGADANLSDKSKFRKNILEGAAGAGITGTEGNSSIINNTGDENTFNVTF